MRAFAVFVAVVIVASGARANYFVDVGPNPVPPFNTISTYFPNWVRVPAGGFLVRIGLSLAKHLLSARGVPVGGKRVPA